MLLSRKYILGHILVFIIVTACFCLSYWQFSRLADRKELNKRVASRMSMPADTLTGIMGATSDVAKNEYRHVSVMGIYSARGQVLVSGRSLNESAGYNVLTPLHISDTDDVVYVNRGWVPQSLGDALLDDSVDVNTIAPQGGYDQEREVIGLIRKNETKQLLGNDKQVVESNPTSARISSELFKKISGVHDAKTLYRVWVQKLSEKIDGKKVTSGTQTNYPTVLDKPKLTELSHFSYAIQWIIFGCTAFITWIIICRKAVQKNRRMKEVST